MTTDPNKPATTSSKPLPLDDAVKVFIGRLHGLVAAQDRAMLSTIKRLAGRTGSLPPAALGMTLALAPETPIDTDHQRWQDACTTVAVAFVAYHAGKTTVDYGSGSVGSALRRLNGPLKPTEIAGSYAARTFGALADAATFAQLRPTVLAICGRCESGDVAPPYWPALLTELTQWTPRDGTVLTTWSIDLFAPNHNPRSKSNA